MIQFLNKKTYDLKKYQYIYYHQIHLQSDAHRMPENTIELLNLTQCFPPGCTFPTLAFCSCILAETCP